jgi:hypothetical protein
MAKSIYNRTAPSLQTAALQTAYTVCVMLFKRLIIRTGKYADTRRRGSLFGFQQEAEFIQRVMQLRRVPINPERPGAA